MKIKLGNLRKLIRTLVEVGGWASAPQPVGTSTYSSDLPNREQIGRMEITDDNENDLAGHLIDPEEDVEDCYGPVPPTSEETGVHQDPYASDYGVLPRSQIQRLNVRATATRNRYQ